MRLDEINEGQRREMDQGRVPAHAIFGKREGTCIEKLRRSNQ